MKASEEGIRGFDFICRTYEDKVKFLCQKLQEKCEGKPLSKHEIALEDFIISGIDGSKVASMIYNIYKNNGKGVEFSEGKPEQIQFLRPKRTDTEDAKHRRRFDTPHQKCGLRQPQIVQPPKQLLLPIENYCAPLITPPRRKLYILKGWILD